METFITSVYYHICNSEENLESKARQWLNTNKAKQCCIIGSYV